MASTMAQPASSPPITSKSLTTGPEEELQPQPQLQKLQLMTVLGPSLPLPQMTVLGPNPQLPQTMVLGPNPQLP